MFIDILLTITACYILLKKNICYSVFKNNGFLFLFCCHLSYKHINFIHKMLTKLIFHLTKSLMLHINIKLNLFYLQIKCTIGFNLNIAGI